MSIEWAVNNLAKRPYVLAVMENYKSGSSYPDVISSISKTLFDYYSKMARATSFGIILE